MMQDDHRSGLPSNVPGLVADYASSGFEEDKAEIFAHMMTIYADLSKRAATDAVIDKKMSAMKVFLAKFCPDMNEAFWDQMRAVPPDTVSFRLQGDEAKYDAFSRIQHRREGKRRRRSLPGAPLWFTICFPISWTQPQPSPTSAGLRNKPLRLVHAADATVPRSSRFSRNGWRSASHSRARPRDIWYRAGTGLPRPILNLHPA
jgi:hypothetical protein